MLFSEEAKATYDRSIEALRWDKGLFDKALQGSKNKYNTNTYDMYGIFQSTTPL